MSRTAKTKHVMNLMGSGTAKKVNPTLQEHALPQRQPVQAEPAASPVSHAPLTSLQELQKLQELEELKEAIAAVESELIAEPKEAEEPIAAEPPSEAPTPEVKPQQKKPQITAVVLELINEELESVVKRFKLEPVDNNLWELTRAVLESVRPEFSLSEEEYAEKSDRLRSRVISEMTKTAIKIAKRDKGAQS
ncbi:MAG: hypothetical protein NC203_01225 [Firmicutes bacterium]|nr:hypothetical protein [[Eubacterium] siraeum]MCM1486962.1 hypothetical protein [Bacillota bacterium]